MFIYSVKAQKIKMSLSIAISVLTVLGVIVFFPANENYSSPVSAHVAIKKEEIDFKNVETAGDHVRFLEQYGWEVEPEARQIDQVTIPVKFDPIYEKYNQMQKNEGLDLEKYKGKTVKKYTYLVNNHDYNGIVYANILIYRNQVIGGDISSAVSGNVIHGFSKDNLFHT